MKQDESAKLPRDELVKDVMEVLGGTGEHAQYIVRLLWVRATLEAYCFRRASKIKNSNGYRN